MSVCFFDYLTKQRYQTCEALYGYYMLYDEGRFKIKPRCEKHLIAVVFVDQLRDS